MKSSIALALLVLGVSASANAADNTTKHKVTATVEHVNFSDNMGSRDVGTLESVSDFGKTTLVVSGSHGRRSYDTVSFNSNRLGASVAHDWNDRFTTRTYGSVASDSPVFARREIGQDFTFKHGPMAYTLGAKHSNYYGDVSVNAISAGGAYYFDRGLVSYRYTNYDSNLLGNTHGHLVSAQLKDTHGKGVTQLWVGQGDSLHEYDYLAAPAGGDMASIAVRRVQPVNEQVTVNFGLGYSKYDLPSVNYSGVAANVGVSYNW